MPRKDEKTASSGAPWTRRAFVSLWLLGFAILGGTLALRWDALIASLAAAPQVQGGAAER